MNVGFTFYPLVQMAWLGYMQSNLWKLCPKIPFRALLISVGNRQIKQEEKITSEPRIIDIRK